MSLQFPPPSKDALAPVFFTGGDAAADMALGLIGIQHLFHLGVQRPVEGRQAFADVLVHGGLADPELPGGGTDGCAVFHDVGGQLTGPLLDVSLQWLYTPYPVMVHVYVEMGTSIPETAGSAAEPAAYWGIASSVINIGQSLKRGPVVTGVILAIFAICGVADDAKDMLETFNFSA